jgi:hypothetical protein
VHGHQTKEQFHLGSNGTTLSIFEDFRGNQAKGETFDF